jgi:hypothetical protein
VEKRVEGNKNYEDAKTVPITKKQARRQSGKVYESNSYISVLSSKNMGMCSFSAHHEGI